MKAPSRATMLAGWLFADLFLVLVLVGLAAIPATPTSSPSSVPSSTTATPAPTREPTATHHPGLDPEYLEFTISLSPQAFRSGAQEELLIQVDAELNVRDLNHRQVGFVLVFASDDFSNIGRAVATATDVVTLLHERSPAFASSAGLGYWNGEGNTFEFKVFFVN